MQPVCITVNFLKSQLHILVLFSFRKFGWKIKSIQQFPKAVRIDPVSTKLHKLHTMDSFLYMYTYFLNWFAFHTSKVLFPINFIACALQQVSPAEP